MHRSTPSVPPSRRVAGAAMDDECVYDVGAFQRMVEATVAQNALAVSQLTEREAIELRARTEAKMMKPFWEGGALVRILNEQIDAATTNPALRFALKNSLGKDQIFMEAAQQLAYESMRMEVLAELSAQRGAGSLK